MIAKNLRGYARNLMVDYSNLRRNHKLVEQVVNKYNGHYDHVFKHDNVTGKIKRMIELDISKNLTRLSKIFSDDVIQVIGKEICDYNYDLKIGNILDCLGLNNFKKLYDTAFNNYSIISKSFSFKFFIQFVNYLNCCDLNVVKSNIDNEEYINRMVIEAFNSNYLDKDNDDYLGLYSKKNISKYKELINIGALTELQLEFDKDEKEYKLLELYIKYLRLLEINEEINLTLLMKKKGFYNNPIFSFSGMVDNIRAIWVRAIKKKDIDTKKLEENGKLEIRENGSKVYHLAGEDFLIFAHDNEFHSSDFDFFDDYHLTGDYTPVNYFCTSIQNKYVYNILDNKRKLWDYSLFKMSENPDNLILFGNCDLFTKSNSKYPMLTETATGEKWIHPYQVATQKGSSWVDSEYTFLRNGIDNSTLEKHCFLNNPSENRTGVFFYLDLEKHKKLLAEEFEYLRNNIRELSYKELHTLIVVYNNKLTDEELNILIDTVNSKTGKEKTALSYVCKNNKINLQKDYLKIA